MKYPFECIGRLRSTRRAGAAIISAAIAAGMLASSILGISTGQAGKMPASGARGVVSQLDDWPQWRGVDRDGRVLAPVLSGGWPAQLSRLWEREIGEGYSGPVVSGDRIWVHSRRGREEVVSALLLASGEVQWSRGYDAPFRQDDDALAHGRGPYATPAVSDGRLFTFGVTGVLSAWNAATGKLLWRRESGKEFRFGFPYFGAAASPLVWGQLCFVHLGGDDRSRADSPGEGAMMAFRVEDGREVWRWAGDGPAVGASPVIGTIGGNSQLIFKTKRKIVGVEPGTGKELWQFSYRVSQDNTIVTPLIEGDRLLTSDYDFGFGAWQIRLQRGDWRVQPLWKTREASLFMSSPVFVGGIVVGFSHFRKGQLFGLDPADGRVLWRGSPRNGEHASLISWGDHLLVFREDGRLDINVVSRSGLRLVREYELGDSVCWGHPALSGHRILIRDGRRLAAFHLDGR